MTLTLSGYSLKITGSIDVPDRTAYVDDDDFADQAFTITDVARFTPGDSLEVVAEAPSGTDYQLELLNRNLNTVASSTTLTGDAIYTFDTGGLEAGTYGVVSTKNGLVQAMIPVVLRAYEVDIASGPSTLQEGDDLNVTADLTDLGTGKSINRVRVFLTTKQGDLVGQKTMTNTSGSTYAVSVPELPEGEYVYVVAVEGTDQVTLPFDTTFLVDDSENEVLGHSLVPDLSVGLSDADKLATNWVANRDGRLQFSTAALTNNLAMVGGLDETFDGLARNTGAEVWEFTRGGDLADSSPEYDPTRESVYVGSGGGDLYSLDVTDGTEKWSYSTGSAIVSSPILANGNVYVGTNGGTVAAVDAGTGSEVWSIDVGDSVLSTPEYDTGSLFVTVDDGRVLALDATDGNQSWVFETGTDLGHASPTVALDTVYVAADVVYALNRSGGSVEWQTPHGGFSESTPVVSDESVFVGADDGSVVSLDAGTGNPEWSGSTGNSVTATPAIVDDRVVIPSTDGRVYVFDKPTGTEVFSRTLGSGEAIRSSPVVRDDEVYLGSDAGSFYVLQNVP